MLLEIGMLGYAYPRYDKLLCGGGVFLAHGRVIKNHSANWLSLYSLLHPVFNSTTNLRDSE